MLHKSILAQSVTSPESRNVSEAYEACGVLSLVAIDWYVGMTSRFCNLQREMTLEDNLLPGFRLKAPLMIVLGMLKSEDPSLRRGRDVDAVQPKVISAVRILNYPSSCPFEANQPVFSIQFFMICWIRQFCGHLPHVRFVAENSRVSTANDLSTNALRIICWRCFLLSFALEDKVSPKQRDHLLSSDRIMQVWCRGLNLVSQL